MKTALVSLVLYLAAVAPADPPPSPQGRLTVAELWSISFPKGEATRQPTATVFRLALVVPFDGWGWVVEAGIATPNTQFAAAPEVGMGPTVKLGPLWSIGAALLYHLNPPYGDHDLTHVLAVSVAPAIKLTDTVTFVFVVGAGKLLDTDGPWSLSVSPKFSIALPW